MVTGSNKGVGYETARQLGKHGLTVIVAARHEDRGQNAADSLKAKGYSIFFHQLDVTDDESIQTFADWVKRDFGGINILVRFVFQSPSSSLQGAPHGLFLRMVDLG